MFRRKPGFTSIELVIATSVSAVVLVLAVTTYGFVMRQTARAAGQASLAVTANEAVEQMRPTIEQAFRCSTYVIANGSTALKCEMPDTVYGGQYAPYRVDTDGTARFQAGASYVFYLSDITGAMAASGNILWRAYVPAGGGTPTPESAWALAYGQHPRVSGVTSLTFLVDQVGHRVSTVMGLQEEVPASALRGQALAPSETTTVVRQFHYRNYQQ
jgi:Tfp pilus assembly protein PilW